MLKKLKSLFTKKEAYSDDDDKVFTGKELDDAYTRGYTEGKKSAEKSYEGRIDSLTEANKEANKAAYDRGVNYGIEFASKNSNVKSSKGDQVLSFTDRRKVKKLRDKLLNEMEDILENTSAGSVRGASIVKEGGKVKILNINNKSEALSLVRRAKDGEIKIIM